MTPVGGVLPVISTPFTDDDRIDVPTLNREIDWLLGAGADGVTVAMVSEILRLDPAERMQLGELVCAAAGERTVVLSIGAESTAQAHRFAEHASRVGATAMMANPPLATSPDTASLLDHFRRLADAGGSTPLIIQDASGYVGTPIPMSVLTMLLEEFGPTKIQFKPEAEPLGQRLSALRDATGGVARVFEGSGGRALVESHRRGVVGTMPGADLIFALVALWRALEAGRLDDAFSVQETIVPLLGFVSSLDSYIAVEKHLLHAQGIFVNEHRRGPVDFALDSVTREQVDMLFARLQDRTAEIGRSLTR